MSYLKQSLSDGETIQKIFNFHWYIWLTPITWIFIGFLGTAVHPAMLIFLVLGVWQIIEINFKEQGVTNKRVIFKKGIISRKTDEMKLKSIETVEIDQSLWGRIFGFGHLKITGRGISDLVFKYIDDPLQVKKTIESVRFQPIS